MMSSSHPQHVRKDTGMDSFWINMLQMVKPLHPHKHESLKEETTKLHKILMMYGVVISVTRDKI